MNVAVIGTGFVGVVSSAVFASHGHTVYGLDIDENKIAALNQGHIPFYEPGLEELVAQGLSSGRLRFTTDYSLAIPPAEIIFVTVGTPSSLEGKADLSYVLAACQTIGPHLKTDAVVVIKSTVPPGSFAEIEKVFSTVTTNQYHLASAPEFLREGSAVEDTKFPDRIVLGVTDETAKDRLVRFHQPFQTELIVTTPESAQLGKYAANSYLALRIGFINQIADFCEKTGADVQDVIKIIGADKRIGHHYWYPGLGYGGSCFPKDVREMAYTSQKLGLGETIFTTLNSINKNRLAEKVTDWEKRIGGFAHKKIAVLGLSFKPHTTDIREAPSLYLIPALLGMGAEVRAYDPLAIPEAEKILPKHNLLKFYSEIPQALEGSDVIIALIEWPEVISYRFETPDNKGRWFIDTRNQFDPSFIVKAGMRYIGIGRGLEDYGT